MADQGKPPLRRRATNSGPKGPAQFEAGLQRTLADQIYSQLHHEITQLVLPPGTPMLEREISARFEASRTPVREAILRLSKEQLVEVVPKSGTFVARIPLSVLPEALVARRAIERDLAARAADQASKAQSLRLLSIVEENREALASGTQEEFDRTDSAFHAQIATMSGFAGLWPLIQQIKTPIDRHRHLTLPIDNRMEQVVNEHLKIAEAISRGDGLSAARLMDDHLKQLKGDTLRTIEQHPSYFIFDIDPSELQSD